MVIHKLIAPTARKLLILTILTPGWVGAADLPQPAIPEISEAHRAFLSRIARRTIRDRILGHQRYELDYIPTALKEQQAEVIIRLREAGFLRAGASSGPNSLALAVRDAAQRAAQTLVTEQQVDLEQVNRLLIEIEVVGTAQSFEIEGDWTEPRVVAPYFEPGIHGLILTGPKINKRFAPTELFTNDLILPDALKRLAQSSHDSSNDFQYVKLRRFRTVHWYESRDTGVVSLHRGLVVLPPDAVNLSTLDEVIAQLAHYLVYRQLDSGLFTYQYEMGLDRYTDNQNLVRQVGALVATSLHARVSGKSFSLSAADLGIRYHRQGMTDFPHHPGAGFLATVDDKNKLGVTALFALALAHHPQAERYEVLRNKLIKGILALQQPSGIFLTAFPPAISVKAQDYFPGEALLALATHYDHHPSGEVLDAFHRAISFYRPYFQNNPTPAFVPWQVQAYALMAKKSKRKDYFEYVFELTDWLADMQLAPDNCPWPEMWGGVAAYLKGRAGVATASYLEGFADALELARLAGDTERTKHYEQVVRRATRFVMQLQVRPEEAYFIFSPQDAVGGIRTTPALNLLRIDHVQHALIGLIKARQVLFINQE